MNGQRLLRRKTTEPAVTVGKYCQNTATPIAQNSPSTGIFDGVPMKCAKTSY